MEYQFDTDVQEKEKVKKPSRYVVILLNDDFTPMEFVVGILENIFHKNSSEAEQIMMQIHKSGQAVAGNYPFDIAETKAIQTMDIARANEYPLNARVSEA